MGDLLSATAGFIGNSYVTKQNNEYAAKREKEARAENYQYGELAAGNADRRTRNLYNDLYSPKAQMEQLKAAGLSPSIYASGGMAGKSGQSGAMGSGASGISPNVFGADPIGAAMQIAQIDNIKAQTEKTKEETKTEAGTNKLGEATINNLLQDTQNKLEEAGYFKTSAEFNKARTTFQLITNDFARPMAKITMAQMQSNLEKSIWESEKVRWQAKREGLQFKFDIATFDTKVEQLQAELTHTLNEASLFIARKAESIKNIELMDFDMSATAERILQGWKELYIKNADQQARQNYMEAEARNWLRNYNLQERKFQFEKDTKEKELDLIKRGQNLNFAVDLLNAYANNMENALGFLQSLMPFAQSKPKSDKGFH